MILKIILYESYKFIYFFSYIEIGGNAQCNGNAKKLLENISFWERLTDSDFAGFFLKLASCCSLGSFCIKKGFSFR